MSERGNYKAATKVNSKQSLQQFINEDEFDHKSPRPPVPGEERSHFTSDWESTQTQQKEWTKIKSSSSSPKSRKYVNYPNESYPASYPYDHLPERGITCQRTSNSNDHPTTFGYKQQQPNLTTSNSSSTTCSSQNSSPPPQCLRWAQSLHMLLQDPDGVKLFQRYLLCEGKHHADALDFWFACEGFKKEIESEKIHLLVKVIYKKFFVKSALPIDEELKKEIGRNIKSSQCLEPPVTLFDEAQAKVEQLIAETTYPNFLKSDMYLQCLENLQYLSSTSSSDFNNELSNLANGPDPLPTVHEGKELIMNPPVHINCISEAGSVNTGYQTPNYGGGVRLTKDFLLMSQKQRAIELRPKTETFASMFIHRNTSGAHAAYNSYNPVSRQDSELHSLSSHSDARTESDNMSMTDSSVDGPSLGRSSRRKAAIEARKTREYAALNQETHMHQIVIPRTQRLTTRQCQPLDRDTFATMLIEKLTLIKRDQEQQEFLERKLKENEAISHTSEIQPRELANAIKEKLQMEDDNDQDILDQHVQIVFPDSTPGGSPSLMSPRFHSPPRNRHVQGYNVRPRRKDKDGFSTFSGDSGNIHDYMDSSEHGFGMVKSKSMQEYDDRFVRAPSGRRVSSKKALTELTDSGVSVVSDTIPLGPVKDSRVLAWLMETDKGGKNTSHTHSEMSVKHRSHRTSSATSPIASRHRKGFGSRSSSLERNNCSGTLGPAQPFVADPSMPPLPIPNTAIQLEEARRRLEDDVRPRMKQRSSSGRYHADLVQSSQSTLRKSMRGSKTITVVPSIPTPITSTTNIDEVTTVVFHFCEEQFPYRTKIPGTQVTLRQFKEYLPKKGNYRYFFKTICEELGNQVIQEEISNDGDILPLWEGRIMAQVKPID